MPEETRKLVANVSKAVKVSRDGWDYYLSGHEDWRTLWDSIPYKYRCRETVSPAAHAGFLTFIIGDHAVAAPDVRTDPVEWLDSFSEGRRQ